MKIYKFLLPFSAHESQLGLFEQKFNSIFRRDHQQKFPMSRIEGKSLS